MFCLKINRDTFTRNYMQWIATLTMCLLNIQAGLVVGWGSPNIAHFTKNNSAIYLTPDEITWVSSSKELAGAFGALFGPLSMQLLGPNMTCLLSFIGYFASWVCIFVANNFIWLLIGRVLCGAVNISAYIAFAIYLGEVSSPEIRGTLISIAITGAIPGVVFSSFMEAHFSPKICCPIYMSACLIGIFFLIFVLPESPYFLVKSKNSEKTKKSIALYFPDEKVEETLLNIQNFVKCQSNYSPKEKFNEIFGSARTRKLVFLTVLLGGLTTASGLVTLQRYLQVILERANSHIIDPENAIIYINLATFVLRLATCNLIDKLGRKFLFVLSGITVSLSIFILGVYFSLLRSDIQMENFEWIPISCVFTFKIFYSIGFTSAMFAILGELCPPNAKNVANFLSYFIDSVISFFLTKMFLPISYRYGEEFIFWTQAACGFLVIPIVVLLLPESKGKKLEEV